MQMRCTFGSSYPADVEIFALTSNTGVYSIIQSSINCCLHVQHHCIYFKQTVWLVWWYARYLKLLISFQSRLYFSDGEDIYFLHCELMCISGTYFCFPQSYETNEKSFRSIRCNEWTQLFSPIWVPIDLIPLNDKVKIHSPICHASLYLRYWSVLFSQRIINPFQGWRFSEIISGRKHWLLILHFNDIHASMAGGTMDYQDILCV